MVNQPPPPGDRDRYPTGRGRPTPATMLKHGALDCVTHRDEVRSAKLVLLVIRRLNSD
jgi:hypothetical protein